MNVKEYKLHTDTENSNKELYRLIRENFDLKDFIDNLRINIQDILTDDDNFIEEFIKDRYVIKASDMLEDLLKSIEEFQKK